MVSRTGPSIRAACGPARSVMKLVAALALSLVVLESVRAEVVYGNLNTNPTTLDYTYGFTDFAQRFTTVSEGTGLHLDLNIFAAGNGPQPYTVELWSATGSGTTSTAGVLLAPIGSGTVSTSDLTALTSFDLTYGLTASTDYFVKLTTTAYTGWVLGPSSSTTLNSVFRYGVGQLNNTDSSSAVGMQVDVFAVPEPAACGVALSGLAIGGFSMWRRRRTRACRPWGSRTFLGLWLTAVLMGWATMPEAAATQVFVRAPDNRQIGPFEVEPSDSIDSLKALVEDRLGTPPDRQYLYSGNQLLLDGRTFSDYTVPNGSTLPLVATWSFGLPSPPLLATWAFGISNVTTGAGTGWTRWSSSSVDFTGSGTGAFVLDVHGYAGSVAGLPAGYDPQAASNWPFLSTQGITGFSAAMFSLTGDFASRASVVQDGTNLVLHVAPVPEPSTCIMAGVSLACGMRSLRRRTQA